jgi:phosphoadenosine phosphosulfate reductase
MDEDPPADDAAWTTWIGWAVGRFAGGLRVACSLSVEDCLVIDEVAGQAAARALTGDGAPSVFVLDTGRLHEDSHQVLERLRVRYPLRFAVVVPDPARLEPLLTTRGPLAFYASIDDRRACCAVRKVEPLGRALAGATAWLTGQRRAQSVTRADLVVLERDDAHGGIAKLSPLAGVTDAALWAEVERRATLVHPLHRAGYPSIGCAPCTRAVAPGADPRSGRWWWEAPEHRECGLHRRA